MPLRSIEILIGEHRQVDKVLEELEGLIDEFLTNPEVPDAAKQALGKVVDFFAQDLILHIQKEDQALFPALEKFLPREQGPLAVMLHEHHEITEAYRGLREGVAVLDQHPATNGPAAGRIRDHGRALIHYLRTHLFKEERVLFPFAEGHLSQEDDREIARRFEEIRANFLVGEPARQR